MLDKIFIQAPIVKLICLLLSNKFMALLKPLNKN